MDQLLFAAEQYAAAQATAAAAAQYYASAAMNAAAGKQTYDKSGHDYVFQELPMEQF